MAQLPPPPQPPPTNTNDELVLRPTHAPPSPARLRAALSGGPIAFLFGLQPSRPPLSYYGRR